MPCCAVNRCAKIPSRLWGGSLSLRKAFSSAWPLGDKPLALGGGEIGDLELERMREELARASSRMGMRSRRLGRRSPLSERFVDRSITNARHSN